MVIAISVFYMLLLPEQVSLRAGDVLIIPYRLALIASVIYLVATGKRGDINLRIPDYAIIVCCFWITFASYVTSESAIRALVQGAAHTTDIALAYFTMRFAIKTVRDTRIFLILIAPGIGLTGFFVLLESLSGQLLVQPLFSALTGQPVKIAMETRLGLGRGASSFPHAILAGICLASFLTIYWMSGLRGWPKLVGIVGALCAFFTMSSAALLGLLVGAAFIFYDWFTVRYSNFTWRLFLAAMAILYGSVELTSNSGFFGLLVRFASLNTVSAYNRVLIWRFGSENVANNPFFGIGYDDWDRPSWMSWTTSFSVDNFWLLFAMRFGVPASALIMLAVALAVLFIGKKSLNMSPVDARLMRGIGIALVVFAFGAISVSLWLNALVWFSMLTGVAVSLGTQPFHPYHFNNKRFLELASAFQRDRPSSP